jgi:hypothetical protein
MKVIVAGSRTIHSFTKVAEAITRSGFDVTEVVSGGAEGIDQIGKAWAYDHGIPSKQFNAYWSENGSSRANAKPRDGEVCGCLGGCVGWKESRYIEYDRRDGEVGQTRILGNGSIKGDQNVHYRNG